MKKLRDEAFSTWISAHKEMVTWYDVHFGGYDRSMQALTVEDVETFRELQLAERTARTGWEQAMLMACLKGEERAVTFWPPVLLDEVPALSVN